MYFWSLREGRITCRSCSTLRGMVSCTQDGFWIAGLCVLLRCQFGGPFLSSRPDVFFSSACYVRNKLLFFFFCLVFPYLSSALKVGGNTEELGCDVKLQLFFLEVVCERNKKYSGGEQGGEKKKNDLLVVPWAAFPLLSGVRGPRAAAQRQGNGAVRCQALAPLPAVQWGGWSWAEDGWAGCHGRAWV